MENKTNTIEKVTVEIRRYAPYAKLNLPKDQSKLIKSEIAKRLELVNVSVSEITDTTAKTVLEHFDVKAKVQNEWDAAFEKEWLAHAYERCAQKK